MRFECLKCCDCCRNLLHKEHSIIGGLSLTPEETSLFPERHIFPSLGIGHRGGPKKIIGYQLDLNICPYLQGGKCSIYTKRPLACRAFPFEIEEVEPLHVLIDKNCRWFKEKVVPKGLWKAILAHKEKIIAPDAMEASWKRLQNLKEFKESKNKWWFDLSRKMWFQYKSRRF